MRTDIEQSEITYVLFGKEAIKLYRLSLKTLINSLNVDFKVGAYGSVKKFVSDTREWDDFVEISKEDFLTLRRISSKKEERKPKKRNFFSKFLK